MNVVLYKGIMSFLKEKIAGILAVIVGALVCCVGIIGVGVYVWLVIDAFGQSDKSWLFWGLIFLVFGIPFLALGASLVVVGIKSYRGNRISYVLSLASLALAVIVGVGLIISGYSPLQYFYQSKQMGTLDSKTQETAQKSKGQIQKLSKVAITGNDSRGFTVGIATAGGASGNYSLEVEVRSGQAIYYKNSELVRLESVPTTLVKRIEYPQLFSLCADSAHNQAAYACVPNTGTLNTKFVLTYRLKAVSGEVSILSTNFVIDTNNVQGRVEVSKFKTPV